MFGLGSHEWHSNESPVHDNVKSLEVENAQLKAAIIRALIDIEEGDVKDAIHVLRNIPSTEAQYNDAARFQWLEKELDNALPMVSFQWKAFSSGTSKLSSPVNSSQELRRLIDKQIFNTSKYQDHEE